MKKTNWYVITGQPCSGKTTVINRLQQMGYQISEEVARHFYLNLMEKNPNKAVLQDQLFLQKEILNIELAREDALDPNALILFDRALPDSIAYYRELGDIPDFVIKAAKRFRYRRVFFLEALPFHPDNVRHENGEVAKRLGRYITEAYEQLGYELIHVPVCSVEERVKYIVDVIGS